MFLGKGSSKNSDEELIEQFRSNEDHNCLSELFIRYSSLVYGVCLKYLKDRDEAKDAVMQIFEKLPGNLKGHSIEHFKSWLYATSRNHCLMHFRSQKRVTKVEIGENFMENEFILHHEEDNGHEKDLTKLERCIEELRSEQKVCVQLFYLKEMCYKDIVEKTLLDLNKVKSHIQNGKRNIKICMEKSG